MPTTYEELRERLSQRPLPTSLPIRKVIRVMRDMGYDLEIRGSHHIFRKTGARQVNFAVHNKRLDPKAVKQLAALLQDRG